MSNGIDRRRFLLTSLAGVLAAPLAAQAQQTARVMRIGYLSPMPPGGPGSLLLDSLRQGLTERGYVDGRNAVIEARFAQGQMRD